AEGIEVNAKAVEAGRSAGVQVDHGSIDALENRPCRYEYIMSSHCVEHVSEVRRLFRAFFHALKPGGILANRRSQWEFNRRETIHAVLLLSGACPFTFTFLALPSSGCSPSQLDLCTSRWQPTAAGIPKQSRQFYFADREETRLPNNFTPTAYGK